MQDSKAHTGKLIDRFIPSELTIGSLTFERDRLLAHWFALEIIVAIGFCLALGSDGLAQFFCDTTHVQMCYDKGYLE